MRITTATVITLAVLLATSSLGAVAATPSATTPTTVERSSSASPSLSPAVEQSRSISSQETVEPPERPDPWQKIRIQIADDGNAVWTIESRFLIRNDTEAEIFNEYANTVVSGDQVDLYNSHTFQEFANLAAESTGREMSIETVNWDDPRIIRPETDVESQPSNGDDVRIGVISYSFVWTNFAVVDGDRLHVGDALWSPDRSLLPILSDGQRLVIKPPENYGFVDTPTSTENGALIWDGPHQFDQDGLEITILQGASSDPDGPDSPSGSGPPLLSTAGWVIVAFLVLIFGAGGYLIARKYGYDPITQDRISSFSITALFGRAEQSDSRKSDQSNSRDATRGVDGGPAAIAQSGSSSTVDDQTPESGAGTSLTFKETHDNAIDPELLSDEERVLRLIDQNGGRMKQATIVSETGWSNAKVSQLLSKMDDDDEIEKLRIGRENLITLPGVDPTGTN